MEQYDGIRPFTDSVLLWLRPGHGTLEVFHRKIWLAPSIRQEEEEERFRKNIQRCWLNWMKPRDSGLICWWISVTKFVLSDVPFSSTGSLQGCVLSPPLTLIKINMSGVISPTSQMVLTLCLLWWISQAGASCRFLDINVPSDSTDDYWY